MNYEQGSIRFGFGFAHHRYNSIFENLRLNDMEITRSLGITASLSLLNDISILAMISKVDESGSI